MGKKIVTIQQKIDHLENLREDIADSLQEMRLLHKRVKKDRTNAQLEQMIAARDKKIAKLHSLNQEMQIVVSDREGKIKRRKQDMDAKTKKKREREILEGRLHKRPSIRQWISVWTNWNAAVLKRKLPYLYHIEGGESRENNG